MTSVQLRSAPNYFLYLIKIKKVKCKRGWCNWLTYQAYYLEAAGSNPAPRYILYLSKIKNYKKKIIR